MIRRTLALAGAAALAAGFTGLAGPAAADPGAGITAQTDILINEVTADLDNAGVDGVFGDLVEIINAGSTTEDVSGWLVIGCNPTDGDFDIATVPDNTEIPAGEKLLIADATYESGGGPDRNVAFELDADLVQSAGGVRLLNLSSTCRRRVKNDPVATDEN